MKPEQIRYKERNLMTEPNRIRQAVATTVFASVLALGAYQGRILPDAEQLTETVHMTCEKEKKDKNIVTASNISEPDQSKHDIEYEELNGSLQTVVYARQQVTLTKEHRIPDVLLTAYEASEVSCGKYADGITKTGTPVRAGHTIAVDPNIIPLGSEVIINGHTYKAEDIGGKIKGHRIDIYMNTISECMNFGVRYADAVWLENYDAIQTIKYTYEGKNLISQEVVKEEVLN